MVRSAPTDVNGAPEQHFVLNGLDYKAYVTIADALGEQPVRLTYNRGSLELMTKSRKHERGSNLLDAMVRLLTLELGIEVANGGGMTFRREVLDRGMEPDDCWWVQHERIMRGRDDYDIERDPPPDLAVEIEVSRNILNRLDIYAALRIPEIWRWKGQQVQILLLGADGKYVESERSRAFPFLPMEEINHFLALRKKMGETELLRKFQEWVRRNRAAWGTRKPSSAAQKPKRRKKT